ncbi:MAG: transposase [Deltaproteobacteria bacterium]|nr:transposase [Deltaproteobacteria bacterium]
MSSGIGQSRRQGILPVELAEVEFEPDDWPKTAKPLRYVALRFTSLQSDLFATEAPRYHAVVSNRYELAKAELVEWHRGKTGTIEHVHRVLRDELGAGVMPCQLFGANAAWFRMNVITFNLLTALKRKALPERFRLARPKRLRYELFTVPAKLAVHESRLSVKASASDARLGEMIEARGKLLHILEENRPR